MARLREDFPVRDRCIYGRNPLAEVIAAVRFPVELAIERQLPVEFQSQLKSRYPLVELRNIIPMMFGPAGTDSKPLSPSKAFDFASEDRTQRVSLAPDNLALTTTAYTRWEEFKASFLFVLSAFIEIYRPPLFTRLGLRYKDIIDRNAVGLPDVPWDRLISGELLKPFTLFSTDLDNTPRYGAGMAFDVAQATLTINLGFVQASDQKTAFLIDTDCYVDAANFRSVDEVAGALEGFHKYSSLAFSRSITDELHAALQPTAVRAGS